MSVCGFGLLERDTKVIFMVSTPPKHPKDNPPLSPPLTVPGGRAGAAPVQNFLQVQSIKITFPLNCIVTENLT